MNRRGLILTTLGALAGRFGLKGVSNVSAAPEPKALKRPLLVTIGTLNVSSQAEQDAFLQTMAEAILKAQRRSAIPAYPHDVF